MERMNLFAKSGNVLRALNGFHSYLSKSTIDSKLQHLIYIRVSQINGCAFCLDMHTKDLRVMGETEQRMLMLGAWHDAYRLYTPKERAALAWAEAVTLVAKGPVSDAIYAETAAHFTEQEMAELTICVIAINSYNRLNVAFQTPAGDYQPGQFANAH
ncbi:carboxymuconolactone decarboxylase family protein [Pseudobacter ginsenosidimutans]|uniref:AhpD family alkylhydroperoxidase n=1 Tax=Pseudobacter ginsenosidimutans TaxID=661488 RepID=A0A4Q7N5B8_9BACT|nr:carboxymuconolactone decarboxylase family protein [Pseudobacter ginsenosidimutans]QEC44760.1 carboxymuconolactone decarboxylase family protein [Pseudobacter ginsenosidimutans]RZS76244.1 AhpD family alkylhydroperoxidase [Pseudobacter ginsenosidimutans]